MTALGVKAMFLIGSNAIFLLPALHAICRRMMVEGTVFLTMGLVSALYHICDTFPDIKHLIFDYRTWQFADFYLSFNLIPIAALMIMFSTDRNEYEDIRIRNLNIKSVAWFLLGVIAAMLVRQDLETPLMVLILGGLCLIIGIVKFIFWRDMLIDWADFIVMWLFIGAGALCFFFCGSCDNYWIWHSIWHICAGIGIFFGVEAKNTTWSLILALKHLFRCKN